MSFNEKNYFIILDKDNKYDEINKRMISSSRIYNNIMQSNFNIISEYENKVYFLLKNQNQIIKDLVKIINSIIKGKNNLVTLNYDSNEDNNTESLNKDNKITIEKSPSYKISLMNDNILESKNEEIISRNSINSENFSENIREKKSYNNKKMTLNSINSALTFLKIERPQNFIPRKKINLDLGNATLSLKSKKNHKCTNNYSIDEDMTKDTFKDIRKTMKNSFKNYPRLIFRESFFDKNKCIKKRNNSMGNINKKSMNSSPVKSKFFHNFSLKEFSDNIYKIKDLNLYVNKRNSISYNIMNSNFGNLKLNKKDKIILKYGKSEIIKVPYINNGKINKKTRLTKEILNASYDKLNTYRYKNPFK